MDNFKRAELILLKPFSSKVIVFVTAKQYKTKLQQTNYVTVLVTKHKRSHKAGGFSFY